MKKADHTRVDTMGDSDDSPTAAENELIPTCDQCSAYEWQIGQMGQQLEDAERVIRDLQSELAQAVRERGK